MAFAMKKANQKDLKLLKEILENKIQRQQNSAVKTGVYSNR